MVDSNHLEELVKQVLKREPEYPDSILSREDVNCLCESNSSGDGVLRSSIFGYPSHPLYKEITNMLNIWIDTRQCPTLSLPSYHLLDEKHYVENRAAIVSSLTPLLVGLESLWTIFTGEEKAFRLRDILKALGRRGIMDLLGIRRTVGSADIWPVAQDVLERAFTQTYGPGSQLSVGARALAKHHHRDSTSSWWGNSTGNEKDKNDHALSRMRLILKEASWINIHCLPGDLKILEVRHPEGYGVRWTADGSSFRGFVEPQMEDGHTLGWRH